MLCGRLLTVHRWLALLACLPLLIVLISGAGLSFVNEFDRAMHPSLLSVAASNPLDIERISTLIESQLETIDADLSAIRYPASSYDPIRLQLSAADNQWLRYINPHTGKLLGERNVAQDWSARLLRLHMHVLEVGFGSVVTLIGTVVLIVMLGLGLSLLRSKSAWKVSGWHAWLGLCSSPVLLLICVSGLISLTGVSTISFTDRVKPALVANQSDLILLNHAEMIKACANRPSELIASVIGATLCCANGDKWLFSSEAGELTVEQSSGNQALLWNIHSGEWAGLSGRAFWMWSVLGVLYLVYSGLRDWYQKVRRSNA